VCHNQLSFLSIYDYSIQKFHEFNVFVISYVSYNINNITDNIVTIYKIMWTLIKIAIFTAMQLN